jgi:putative intracellular protease/amidase
MPPRRRGLRHDAEGLLHMSDELGGKTVAFLVANEGVEQVELTEPWRALKEAGATPRVIRPRRRRGSGV